jgi:hypothetical protein
MRDMKTLICSLVAGLLLIFGEAQARELAIVANKMFPFDRLTTEAIKEIYQGEKTKEGSIKIQPFDQKDPSIKKKFLKEILGTTPDGYNGYWMKRVFQEGGVPPVLKEGSSEILQQITRESGGIGYVWKSEAEGKPNVKILLTIEVGE